MQVHTGQSRAARRRSRRSLRILSVAGRLTWSLLPFAGCTGEISGDYSVQYTHLPGAPDAGAATKPNAGAGGTTSAGAAAVSPNKPTNTACTATPQAAPAPLARLTNLEHHNTLQTLFPTLSLPEIALPADIIVEGFDNNAKAQTPSPALIEQYQVSARAVAEVVTAHLDAVLPCPAGTTAQQDSCGPRFIEKFVTRAYRRPLTTDETTRYTALFRTAASTYDFATAIGMVVQAALQSPSFLYRIELGGPAQNGVVPLNGYELASRLSYFFWDSAPDDALLTAAGSGELATTAGVEKQARRLLADARAHAAVSNLFHQWLRFDKMDRMPKDAGLYPAWNDDVQASLRSSTNQFVEHVFWDLKGSLNSLLTAPEAYVDENIAPIYGLTAAGGGGLRLTATDPSQRSGILTQAGLLAAFAHETTDSPVLRGVFVMDRLLCSAPPPPPPGVTGSIMETTVNTTPMTTRDRFAMTHEQGTCATCHHSIDGFGFGFSHYDAIGRWRDTENGIDVNAKGWIANTRDADGDFAGAVDLGQRLAQSTQVRDCVASQWFRYSLGLGAADVETCALEPVVAAFQDHAGSLQELMIATVTSAAFRNRPEVTP